MKPNKVTLLYSFAFLLLLAPIILGLPATATVVEASVKFDPDYIDWGAPGWTYKEGFIATLWFEQKRYHVKDVDPKTILLDGVLEPKGGWKHGVWIERDDELKRKVLRILFAGSSLVDHIVSIIIHMDTPQPGLRDVPLTITGNFYDGTPFEGTGYITVYIPPQSPHPPPLG